MKNHIDKKMESCYYLCMKNMNGAINMFGFFSKSNVIGVNGKEIKEFIKREKDLVIIDIRTAMEVGSGKIPGAKHIDFYDSSFQSKIDKLDREKKYLVYCASGGRSKAACGLMEKMNFKNIYELKGGYGAY